MRKKMAAFIIREAVLLCACSIILAGCGKEAAGIGEAGSLTDESVREDSAAEEQAGQEAEENAAAAADEAENLETAEESSSDGTDAKDMAGENTAQAQTLYEARVRHQYGGILSQIIAAWQLPDREWDTSSLREGFGEMRDNRFAVTDIDGDGREELIVCNGNASMAGMIEMIYDYDPESGRLKSEFSSFPALTYYDNGIIKAESSHNQGMGEFWPFILYRYEPESDSYVEIGAVESWDKAERETWYDGRPFPDELDTDGDGTLYLIRKEGEEASYEYEDFKYNQADFDEWFGAYLAGAPSNAKEIVIDYQPMEYESFADFTPDYLRMTAGEVGRERTDTDADLGLLILEDSEEHYLNAAKKLLAEKYGVAIEQPEENFEEYSVGLLDGKERFSFTMLDSGDLSYMGEKVEDVTIFGIYPGISVDGAWEKLKAYGIYASPYGEAENCLITGEGFGNISIWFSAEDNVVTDITVRPYCAFAG